MDSLHAPRAKLRDGWASWLCWRTRRYLDYLCRLSMAEVTMRYGGPGRPELPYQLVGAQLPLAR